MNYFGEIEEQAIIDFNLSKSSSERNQIFETKLNLPLHIMCQCILKSYFSCLINKDELILEDDALAHLVDKMSHFDPNKAKAYSYCQTIVKNYFIQKCKNNLKNQKRFKHDYDKCYKIYEIEYDIDYDYKIKSIINDTINKIEEKILKLNGKDKRVGEAIIYLLKNYDKLFKEKMNKLTILEELRIHSGLTTKEIHQSILKHFKRIWLFEKKLLTTA